MPSRVVPFVDGEFYHVFNRGVAQMHVYQNTHDYKRFLKTCLYYQIEGPKPKFSAFTPISQELDTNKKIVEIVCYCFMPNHFHFLLKQVRENGITEFLSKISNSYTKYFNTKNQRVGPLFQGEFKSVHIDSDEQLIHLSRYIHLNPLVGYVTKSLENYKWSSYLEFLGIDGVTVCAKNVVTDGFKNIQDYRGFVLDQVAYSRELDRIKHALLE